MDAEKCGLNFAHTVELSLPVLPYPSFPLLGAENAAGDRNLGGGTMDQWNCLSHQMGHFWIQLSVL